MDKISLENYQVEDFISDESFINYHFKSNKTDEGYWEMLISNHPHKLRMVNEARRMLDDLSFNISEKEYNEELKKITTATSLKETTYTAFGKSNKGSFAFNNSKKRILQLALTVLVVVIACTIWLLRSSQNNREKLTQTVNNTNIPMVLTLSDSTIVSLAPHSYLDYPLNFEEEERNVYLHGNAQFSVKRNVHHPFKVHAENIIATVLGTVFNIKTSGDSAIVVELLKGKLNVEIPDATLRSQESVLLNPNERAVYVRNEKHLYKNLIIPENHIYFRQNDFDEIALRLKNVFGVTVVNESNNKAWRFTGTFINSTATEIIENICLVKKLSFAVKEDTIVIK